MKALTALTTVAALIVSASVANAYTSMHKPSMGGVESTNAQYCIKTPSGALNCKFVRLNDCRTAARSKGAKCVVNPAHATTGSGTNSSMGNKMDTK